MDLNTATPAATVNGTFKVANLNAGEARHELSRQWMARPFDQKFLNLSDLQRHVETRAERCKELRAENKAIELLAPEPTRLEDTHKLTLGLPDGTEVAPTNWAFGQLAGLAGAPAGYLRTLPSQIVADALNFGMRVTRKTEQLKAFYDPESLRAATGPDYGRIYDHEVVAAVRQVAGNGDGDTRWKVPGIMDWRTMVYNPHAPITMESTTLFASDRDVFIFLVDDLHPIVIGKTKNGEDDIVFRGFYITQSEVGSSALKLAVFYLRGICMNRILWGVEGFEEMTIRHTKSAPARFVEQARPALEAFSTGSVTTFTEGVEKAKAAIVAKDEEEAIEFLRERSFSRKRAVDMLTQFHDDEGKPARSAWDIAQAITANARDIPFQDERFAAEQIAGRVLDKVA
jgi:Domain of unknown function (DUF932)